MKKIHGKKENLYRSAQDVREYHRKYIGGKIKCKVKYIKKNILSLYSGHPNLLYINPILSVAPRREIYNQKIYIK